MPPARWVETERNSTQPFSGPGMWMQGNAPALALPGHAVTHADVQVGAWGDSVVLVSTSKNIEVAVQGPNDLQLSYAGTVRAVEDGSYTQGYRACISLEASTRLMGMRCMCHAPLHAALRTATAGYVCQRVAGLNRLASTYCLLVACNDWHASALQSAGAGAGA